MNGGALHAVTWRYHDRSGNGVVAILQSREVAEWLLNILDACGDSGRVYELATTESISNRAMNTEVAFWRVPKLMLITTEAQAHADEQEAGVAVNALVDWERTT